MSMKITELIASLDGIQRGFGDIKVVLGETNGVWVRRYDVNVESDEATDNRENVCVLQGYLLKGKG